MIIAVRPYEVPIMMALGSEGNIVRAAKKLGLTMTSVCSAHSRFRSRLRAAIISARKMKAQ